MDREGYEAPDIYPEDVKVMIHARLEANRLRCEENERLSETRNDLKRTGGAELFRIADSRGQASEVGTQISQN
jgi:hypothetical protein